MNAAVAPTTLPASRTGRDVVGDSGCIRFDAHGVLHIEDVSAPELAERFGSPLYVTSERQIRENVRRLRAAFESRWGQVTLLFATKANSNLAVRRILTEEGVGGDCFGLGELAVSLRGGVSPDKLVMNGSNKSADELRAAVHAGVTINVDHPSELEAIVEIASALGRRADVCLRVLPFSFARPDGLPADLAAIATDRSHDKWGMDRETLLDLTPRALASDNVRLRGLHLHVSRLRPTPEHFELAATLVGECMRELRDAFDWQPALLDFGGGFAHERDPESGQPAGTHRVASPEEYAEALTGALRRALAEHRLAEPHLLLEPGRRLVSNATVLLGRVGVVKRLPSGSATWINVDASTNHCPRAPLQNYYYEIVHATKGLDPAATTANVVGPTCVIDLLGEERALPNVETGDLLAVLDVGGYAEVLSSQFNMVPRPATVLVHGSSCDLIRRRETLDDIFATQVVPPRLVDVGPSTGRSSLP
jgi:diaminopimelate decarboxylase